MKKKLSLMLVVLVAVTCALFAQGGTEEAYPTKNITLTVPHNAGGSTDLTARAVASEMSKNLGVQINVVNTPGAGGSVGTLNVQNAKVDGYSLLANGMLAFTTMPIQGYTDKTWKDWDIWLATYSANAIVVGKNSPYNTIYDLVADVQAHPNTITAGTSGIGTGGYFGAETVNKIAGAELKQIPYGGGAAAVTALLSGEIDCATSLLAEYKDLILAGEVKLLCTLSDEDIELAPGVIAPSILDFYPEAKSLVPMGEITGILMPKGLSDEKLAVLDEAFDKAVNTQAFADFCDLKSFDIMAMGREESQEFLDGFASRACFMMYDAGATKINPADFGMHR